MKSRIQIYSQRFALASFAAAAITACQAPGAGEGGPIVAPSLSPSQLNAVCDPFGSAGGSTPGGPVNGLLANLSYLPDGNTHEYSGVMDFEQKATPVSNPVYLSQLYVPTEAFTEGFQSANGTYLADNNGNKLTAFFALHMESTIQLTPSDAAGDYQFALVSDDGSIMQINNGSGWVQLINIDGDHETEMGCARQSVSLSQSSALPIQIDYFQGPPNNIALILLWRKVSSNSTWHNDDNGQCDGGNANPLNDPSCGQSGNDLFFKWENQVPSVGNQNWVQLLARGWSVVPAKNFVLANGNSNPCNTNTQCFTDTFNQPQQLATSSVDFLLMTDTDNGYNRSDIAGALQNFAGQLPAGVDFSVGLMGGYGNHGKPGTLMHAPSVPTVLSSKSLAISDMQTQFAQSIRYLPDDYESNEGELGLYSLQQGMAAANVQSAQANGFLRQNAALSVVFLSDDSDQCAVDASDYRECAGITPASVLAAIQGVKGNQPVSINSIVRTVQAADPSEYGKGYIDLVNLLGKGLNINMLFSSGSCGNSDGTISNFPQAMQSIGQQVASLLKSAGNVQLLNDFTLSHTGIDPSSIAVSVDGAVEPYSYNANQDQVDLSHAGTYGSTIQVNYCLASASPSPSPSPSVTVTPSPSPSPSVTVTPSPSPSPSVTVTPSPSPSPSVTVTPSPSPSPTDSSSPSPSPSPTDSSSPSPSPSASPSPTDSPSPSPSPSPSSSSCTGPFCGGGVLGN